MHFTIKLLFRRNLITKIYRAENILSNKPNENEIVSDYNRLAFILHLHHKTAFDQKVCRNMHSTNLQ